MYIVLFLAGWVCFKVGRKVANKTGAGQTSNYSSWQCLHFIWEDIIGYEHLQNHPARLVLVYLPAWKCHAESESIKMYAYLLPNCLSEIQLYNVWKLPDCVWDFMNVKDETFLCWIFTNYEMWDHSYEPDLKIRQWREQCHQWSPHLCKYQQEQGQLEVMFSVNYDCKGFLLHLLSLPGMTVNVACCLIGRTVTDWFNRWNLKVLEHSLYSPNVRLCDSRLF
jgi:hypothetical protein